MSALPDVLKEDEGLGWKQTTGSPGTLILGGFTTNNSGAGGCTGGGCTCN